MKTPAADSRAIAHVISPDLDPGQLDWLLALLDSVPPESRAVLTCGPPNPAVRSRATIRALHAPAPIAALRQRALRGAIARHPLLRGARRVRLHAWTPTAAAWAVASVDPHTSVVIDVPPGADPRRFVHWPVSGRLSDVPQYVCHSASTLRALVAAGVPPQRCAMLPPARLPAPAEFSSSDAVRAALRLCAGDRVAVVLPPVTRATGGYFAAWAGLLVEKVHGCLRIVAPGGSREAERIGRLARAVRHDHMVRLAPAAISIHDLLAAADVSVYLEQGDGSLSTSLTALGTGVPLIAVDTPTLRAVLPSEDAAWLVADRQPKTVAAALLRVLDHPEEATRRAVAARDALAGRFEPAARLAAYRTLYDAESDA